MGSDGFMPFPRQQISNDLPFSFSFLNCCHMKDFQLQILKNTYFHGNLIFVIVWIKFTGSKISNILKRHKTINIQKKLNWKKQKTKTNHSWIFSRSQSNGYFSFKAKKKFWYKNASSNIAFSFFSAMQKA